MNRPREETKSDAKGAGEQSTKRALPNTKTECEEALAMYRVMSVPVVAAVSSGWELAGAKPLDPVEKDSGEFSIAALLYQEGAGLDAKVFCLLWAASISAPRLAEIALARQKKHEAKRAQETVTRTMEVVA